MKEILMAKNIVFAISKSLINQDLVKKKEFSSNDKETTKKSKKYRRARA
jgi:hypothetical protein